MKIDGAIALVTGTNRGIGLPFTRELLARGTRKVYAGARDPSTASGFFWIRSQTLARTSRIELAFSAASFDSPEEKKHA